MVESADEGGFEMINITKILDLFEQAVVEGDEQEIRRGHARICLHARLKGHALMLNIVIDALNRLAKEIRSPSEGDELVHRSTILHLEVRIGAFMCRPSRRPKFSLPLEDLACSL